LEETGVVPEYCTCGAELPPDARFCHKCGKPQRDEPNLPPEVSLEQLPVQRPIEPPALSASAPEIGFRNSLAVRVGFLAGSLAFLLSSLPFHPVIRLLLLLGAGVFSVYMYRRRSGYPLEIRGGVRMGWLTGLFCFVIFMVLFTISFAALSMLMRDGGMSAAYHGQLTAMGMSPDKIQQAMEIFQSPIQLAGMLVWLFVTSTFVPALGGALGARLFHKN
jgi:hypothetical protein